MTELAACEVTWTAFAQSSIAIVSSGQFHPLRVLCLLYLQGEQRPHGRMAFEQSSKGPLSLSYVEVSLSVRFGGLRDITKALRPRSSSLPPTAVEGRRQPQT